MVAAISDPQAVAVLRNEGGALSCVPLLAFALPAATPNAVRKLFQLNRVDTISAIMHDVVLVPEGRTDHDWLKLLVRAVDLRQSWAAADESRFGSYIGVVPTHDAAVEATTAALSRLHPRITAVVDGDGPGVGYAQALAAAVARPAAIIRWPDEDETAALIDRFQLDGVASVADVLAALEALPRSGPVREACAWVRHQARARGRTEFSRADIEIAITRQVAVRRQRYGADNYDFVAMTIQQAKNREFERVFVLWPYQIGGNAEHKRRLLYNALTRAQRWCTKSRRMQTSCKPRRSDDSRALHHAHKQVARETDLESWPFWPQ
jgi:UvrD-like helicase C-terminal domain